jgi:hypothetical protein
MYASPIRQVASGMGTWCGVAHLVDGDRLLLQLLLRRLAEIVRKRVNDPVQQADDKKGRYLASVSRSCHAWIVRESRIKGKGRNAHNCPKQLTFGLDHGNEEEALPIDADEIVPGRADARRHFLRLTRLEPPACEPPKNDHDREACNSPWTAPQRRHQAQSAAQVPCNASQTRCPCPW